MLKLIIHWIASLSSIFVKPFLFLFTYILIDLWLYICFNNVVGVIWHQRFVCRILQCIKMNFMKNLHKSVHGKTLRRCIPFLFFLFFSPFLLSFFSSITTSLYINLPIYQNIFISIGFSYESNYHSISLRISLSI